MDRRCWTDRDQLHYILGQLRAAAPDAEIITFTNYDVAFLFDARLLQLTQAFNSVVIYTAAESSVRWPMSSAHSTTPLSRRPYAR